MRIALTLLLQKESENQSMYPIETPSEPQFSDSSSKKNELLWVVDLSLKLTIFSWQKLVCRNLRCRSSSGVQWLQYLFFYKDALSHTILKIFQDPRSIKRYCKEKVSSSNASDFLGFLATFSGPCRLRFPWENHCGLTMVEQRNRGRECGNMRKRISTVVYV